MNKIKPTKIEAFMHKGPAPEGENGIKDLSKPGIFRMAPGSVKRPSMTYVEPSAGSANSDEGYYWGEYPLVDIGAAEDTDSYVFQANFKKLALAMKEGWSWTGKNKASVDYIKKRVSQIEHAQGQTFRSLLIELVGTVLRYHAAYIIKARNEEKSGGLIRRQGKKRLLPVAGYFVASPVTIMRKVGKDNKVKSYKHVMPDGRYVILRPEDVIPVYVNKKPHFLSPTPPWHPVIEDIQALRRIEEHIENLIYQHLYPLYQYVVGTEALPMRRYEDGSTEVDVVRLELRDMPSDGMLVTPERHAIKGLGSESRALRAEVYVQHFKNRVITGSGMSQLDFGEGDTANRATADSMSKLAVGNVKFYQQCVADTINFEVIRELLLESTFQFDPLAEENIVELQFTEIDHEAQIKLQNHYMLLYQSNLISRTEARLLCGWEGEMEDEDSFSSNVTVPEMKAQGEIAAANKPPEQNNGAAKNKQQPTNQHGANTGPAKRKSSTERDGVANMLYGNLVSDLRNLNRRVLNLGAINQLFMSTETSIKSNFKSEIEKAVMDGVRGYVLTGELLQRVRAISDSVFQDFQRDVERLFREASRKTMAELTAGVFDDLAVERLRFRIRFIEDTVLQKAFIRARVQAMRNSGEKVGVIKSQPGGEDFDTWNNVRVDLTSVTIEDLPPFHPNCKCIIVREDQA